MKPHRENTSRWIEDRLKTLDGSTVFSGYGSFVDANTVQVGDEKITGKTIVVHVGTRPRTPDVPGIESVSYLTNESLLDLEGRDTLGDQRSNVSGR